MLMLQSTIRHITPQQNTTNTIIMRNITEEKDTRAFTNTCVHTHTINDVKLHVKTTQKNNENKKKK